MCVLFVVLLFVVLLILLSDDEPNDRSDKSKWNMILWCDVTLNLTLTSACSFFFALLFRRTDFLSLLFLYFRFWNVHWTIDQGEFQIRDSVDWFDSLLNLNDSWIRCVRKQDLIWLDWTWLIWLWVLQCKHREKINTVLGNNTGLLVCVCTVCIALCMDRFSIRVWVQ